VCYDSNTFLQKGCGTLPVATQQGTGIFACMYDGNQVNITGAYATYQRDAISGKPFIAIVANNTTTVNPKTIYLHFHNISSSGIFPLGQQKSILIATLPDRDKIYAGFNGTIEITKLDTIGKIISGVFNADLFLSDILIPQGNIDSIQAKDTVLIRSGKFDLPLTVFPYGY
jgi:hypothetical protein